MAATRTNLMSKMSRRTNKKIFVEKITLNFFSEARLIDFDINFIIEQNNCRPVNVAD